MNKNSSTKLDRSFKYVLYFTVLYMVIPVSKSASDNAECSMAGRECFPTNNKSTSGGEPFFPPPQSLEEINPSIFCYTRSLDKYNVSLGQDMSLNSCPFDSSKRTVIITHGFLSDGNFPWLRDVALAYFNRMDVNVFIVDWGGGAGSMFLDYFQAASNIKVVSCLVIRFLKYLKNGFGLIYKTLHLIGFSLGAHLFGLVGQELKNVGRITGLDPAGLGFEDLSENCRLDSTDAIFVDVSHTSAAPFIPFFGFGIIRPCGDVDYYPNGGFNQPDCPEPQVPPITNFSDMANATPTFIKLFIFCNHLRSHRYLLYSLYDNCTIWGYPTSESALTLRKYTPSIIKKCTQPNVCDSQTCSPMGLDTPDSPLRGIFDVCTSGQPPYCLGNSGVKTRVANWF